MKPKRLNQNLLGTALTLAFSLPLLVQPVSGATSWVGNTDANFATLANWNTVTPNSNTPVFGIAGTAGTSLTNNISNATYIGFTFSSGASAYTFGGNAFTLTANIVNSSTSTQTFSSGMNITTAGGRTFTTTTGGGNLVFNNNITQTAGGTSAFTGAGTTTLAGTNSLTFSSNDGAFSVNTNAVVNITGATTLSATSGSQRGGQVFIGTNTPSTNTLTVATGGSLTISGTANAAKGASIIGQQSIGILNVNGTLTVNNTGGFLIGNTASNQGTGSQLNIGTGGLASFTATGAAGTDGAYILIGRQGGTGTLNLNGGVLETSRTIARNGGSTTNNGTANVNFNGGTLKALANNSDWLASTTTTNGAGTGANTYALTATTVRAGGAKIDTNGFNVGIGTVLAHEAALGATVDGGLVKSGTGTLTLSAANTYTGATAINAGTLAVNGSLAAGSAVAVNNGGTLGGSGTVGGAVTVNSGGVVGPGNSPGVLTTGSATFNSGSVFSWELNSNAVGTRGTNYDGLTTTGNLSAASGAIFRVVLTDTASLSDTFWNSNQTWTNIFSVGGTTTLADTGLFNTFQVYDSSGTDITSTLTGGRGFTMTGTTLNWTAVPEPTSALAGLLLGAGLLRRRRVA